MLEESAPVDCRLTTPDDPLSLPNPGNSPNPRLFNPPLLQNVIDSPADGDLLRRLNDATTISGVKHDAHCSPICAA
jgi:hypothetical protein